MKKALSTIVLFAVCIILSSCSALESPKPENKPAKTVYGNEEALISLQNLNTRVVVYCYQEAEQTSEDCARYFEKKGYVRFRDIPYKTADYDFLKKDTYPTRRWRDGEKTPRW